MGNPDEFAQKVTSILKEGFAPAEIGASTRDGIVIWVISDRFEGMGDMDRQEAMWDLLQKSLSREEQRAVSIVVGLTTKEREFHTAGSD